MKQLFYLLLLLILGTMSSYAQTTAIPDTAFEAQLIAYGIDSDNTINGQILTSDAIGVTSLHINGTSFNSGTITSLAGIEIFVDLENLNCSYNNLTSLDLSGNTALFYLTCSENNLDSIDISTCTGLTYLDCEHNNLIDLDVMTNPALQYLSCIGNNLTSLDLSANITLWQVYCIDNNLTELYLEQDTAALIYLDCSLNLLDSLDVSANINLRTLGCSDNNLVSLITNNPALEILNCKENSLTTLDLSLDTALVELFCENNDLTSLDVTNNRALKRLYCQNNKLIYLGVVGHPSLQEINCYKNELEILDLSGMDTLGFLSCMNNKLKKLILADNPQYTSIGCHYNEPFLEICVPDMAIALAIPSNQWVKDASARFTEHCSYPNALEGQVLIDANNNCIADSTEQALSTQLVLFENGLDSIYTGTNNIGYYLAHLDTGIYTVSVIPSHPYYTICPSSQQVTVDTNQTIQQVDFSLQEIAQCPYLEVAIAAPILRRCFANNYYVNYCNNGTVDAPNAYVEVELDSTLYYNSSSLVLHSQVGNKYRFNVGNIAVGECGSFSINVNVSCAAELGQIHCAEVHAYPDNLCLNSLVNIQIEDTCLIDTVAFTIQNNGDGFAYSLPYFILEDTTIVDTGSVLLGTGQRIDILYPIGGLGHSYQLILAPSDLNYYTASTFVSCDPNAANFNLIYNPYSQQEYMATDCQPNRGSYDPNDKQAMPIGFGSQHYISSNTDIEYKIRFQNTGTDTAIFVNIVDTFSSNLDVASLEMGAASHPYTWEFMPANSVDEQVLRITFDQIYLADSNVNEAASHGFVKFKIKQKPNLANGIRIENNAAIYFDYNASVLTNTAFHTICDNCLLENITGGSTVITNQEELSKQKLQVQVMPNPFSTQTTIEINGASYENLELKIYDLLGRAVVEKTSNTNRFQVQRGMLSGGIYIYKVSANGELLHSHKLVVK